jgi:glyceraldehyde 3-phosphate dehydrogenase (phosphorylating)
MTTRVGINGLGRIGRAYLRSVLDADDIEVVAANDVTDTATLARLLRHDSTFGPLGRTVSDLDDALVVDGHKIAVSAVRDPAELPWADYGVDVVIESTGKFRTREGAAGHLAAGARKVLISAPGKGVDATIVLGVNEDIYDPQHHHIISNASCTTNCVAPMVRVLHDAFGIEQGYMTTVHAYTNDQNVLDAPHKDPRRARSAAVNIIPTTTGAARAVAEVIPAVAGRLDGVALRVPVVDGSLVDLAVLLDRKVEVDEVNAAFEWAATIGRLAGRLEYSTDPLVSTDVIGNPASCIFDSGLTQAAGRMVKVFGWYDNEWGYTARLVDLTRLVAGLGAAGEPA